MIFFFQVIDWVDLLFDDFLENIGIFIIIVISFGLNNLSYRKKNVFFILESSKFLVRKRGKLFFLERIYGLENLKEYLFENELWVDKYKLEIQVLNNMLISLCI